MNAIAVDRYLVKRTRTRKTLNCLLSFIRLSDPSRRRESAWGAEGLRGNEANENNLMVLASAPARKCHQATGFAQEDMAGSF